MQKLKYDWDEIQRYYDADHSIKECRDRFGFRKVTWAKAVKAGRIKPRGRVLPLEKLLVANRATNGHHLKSRLLEAKLLVYKCYECGLMDWRDKPLSLHLDHINGNHADNRIENLRLLCPNCHDQTPTFGSKGLAFQISVKKKRLVKICVKTHMKELSLARLPKLLQ